MPTAKGFLDAFYDKLRGSSTNHHHHHILGTVILPVKPSKIRNGDLLYRFDKTFFRAGIWVALVKHFVELKSSHFCCILGADRQAGQALRLKTVELFLVEGGMLQDIG